MKYTLQYIEEIKKSKVKGIIFGSLDSKNKINKEQLKQILSIKGNLEFVFNDAIDFTNNYLESLKTLSKLGVNKLITSGQSKQAVDGVDKIKIAMSKIETVIIRGGVGLDNIEKLYSLTNNKNFHVGSDL
jgi:copper homeostasis protein